MPILPSVVLPKRLFQGSQRQAAAIRVSPLLIEAAQAPVPEVLQKLQTSPQGLTEEEAQRRLDQFGPNVVAQERQHTHWHLLGVALVNPLVILLVVLSVVSFLTDDPRAGTVMALMVLLGVVLRFVQEVRADAAAAKLKAMSSVTATVVRAGQPREI